MSNFAWMKKYIVLIFLLAAACSMDTHAEHPEKGYRGFAEIIADVKADIALYGGVTDSRFHAGAAISQGYQFNSWLYTGGGIAVEQCVKDNSIYSAPIFAHVRTDLKLRRFTPYIDIRAGYNFARYGGIYFSPAIGYRINWGKPTGINIGVGWTMTGNREYIEDIVTDVGAGTNTVRRRVHQWDGTIALRLGIDF